MNSLKTEKTRILQNSVEFCKIRAFSTTKNPAETKGSAGQIIGRNNRGCGIFTDSYRFRQQTTLGLSVGGDSACEILLVYGVHYLRRNARFNICTFLPFLILQCTRCAIAACVHQFSPMYLEMTSPISSSIWRLHGRFAPLGERRNTYAPSSRSSMET